MSFTEPDTPVEDRTDPALGQDPLSQMAEAEAPAEAPPVPEESFDNRFDEMARQLADELEARNPEVEPAAEVVPEPEPEPEPTPEPPAAVSDVLAGLDVTEDEAREVIAWAKSLTPEQVDAVNAALANPVSAPAPSPAAAPYAPPAVNTPPGVPPAASGYGYPAPPAPAVGAGLNDPVTPPAVGQPGMPVVPDLGVLAEVAPELGTYLQQQATLFQQQQQQLAWFQAEQQRIAAADAARNEERINAQIAVGADEFRAAYPQLSEQDVQRIARRATELQVMPALVQQNQGAVDKAFVQAMNTAMWSDPTYQDQLVQARLDEFASQQAETQQRRGKAASLNGGGGSVSRATQAAAPADMTPEQRRQALIAGVAAGIEQR